MTHAISGQDSRTARTARTNQADPVDRSRAPRPPDFRALLGHGVWEKLPWAVRQRFAAGAHGLANPITFRGRMSVRASRLGRYMAQLCRLIGTSVAPFVHDDVPVTVRVFDKADGSGTVWERRYEFPGRSPVIVTSTKRLEHDGVLVEALGAGLRMCLKTFELDGALHFLSTGYFFQVGPWRIPLPAWLPPGTTHVIHEDQGAARFRFTMRTDHPDGGEMYFQSGLFTDGASNAEQL